jgi:LysM repeat protein
MYKRAISFLLAVFIFMSVHAHPASAQTSGPVYIVQAGDTLSFIASRFNVSLNDLIAANPSINPNILSQGSRSSSPGSRE